MVNETMYSKVSSKWFLAVTSHNFKWVKSRIYFFNLRPTIRKSWCLNTHFNSNNSDNELINVVAVCALRVNSVLIGPASK